MPEHIQQMLFDFALERGYIEKLFNSVEEEIKLTVDRVPGDKGQEALKESVILSNAKSNNICWICSGIKTIPFVYNVVVATALDWG